MTLADAPEVLTVPEAAAILRVGRTTLFDAIARGEVPAIRVGRRVLVARATLEQLIAAPSGAGCAD